MNPKDSRMNLLMLDLCDCLTVIKGLVQTSYQDKDSESYRVLIENIENANEKISSYFNRPKLSLISKGQTPPGMALKKSADVI